MQKRQLIRKICAWMIGALGAFLSSAALLFGYAAIQGGYYHKTMPGLLGDVIAVASVAMFTDWSIALFFWLGIFIMAVSPFVWPWGAASLHDNPKPIMEKSSKMTK